MAPIDDAAGREAIRSWIDQQHAELDQKSYYQLLGVERNAGDNDIRIAYYHMVARFHPDLYGDILETDIRARLVTLYSRLVEGYRVLRDPQKRQQYGKLLEQGKLRWTLEEERSGGRRDPDADVGNPNARRFFKLGKAALASGDFKGAVVNLKLALSVEPDSTVIQAELARADAALKGK
jgi:DnaJ-class molecular chaperone